ncbi:MAG: alpha-amylase [Candidatus Altiarchaeales archaeon IMC4]|nr:MAG: alpha-amylase [Candidatus Altiarchaeales archaeon IMC4]
MASVCFYFQVHQPNRLKWFWPDDGRDCKGDLENLYFDKGLNEWTFRKVAKKCYWDTNRIMLEHIDRYKSERRKFKVSYSITGTWLDQCERWEPDILETFKQMAESGCAEFLGETYYHCLSSLFLDKGEFVEEVKLHSQAMKDLLGVKPQVFRNTELIYNDDIVKEAEKLGFKGILAEGIEWILDGWKSPNYVYNPANSKMALLLRNYKLSDDVGYRFSARWWQEHPLTADKYASWLSASPGDTLNLFMDYETFGEHQWAETGILEFLKFLPGEILKRENLDFATPSEVIKKNKPVGEISVPWYMTASWADLERDTSAWIGNHMQQLCFSEVQRLGWLVKKSKNQNFKRLWRMLLTSDHYHYMCTKGMGDQSVHEYFSHHGNAYDAAINYLAVVSDFKEKVWSYLSGDDVR